MTDKKKPDNIDINAENDQLITIRTKSGYVITIYTGDYTDKSVSVEVGKMDYDW